ncbi:hypothetical protein HHI36_009338 [Cryptolaemus montrouzieri]|uniref:Uncharacterized protein n=1 Tax=Cryptolaemus montrouzieri TaxID=559131 RepID=A0ABD2MV72_9CUCU
MKKIIKEFQPQTAGCRIESGLIITAGKKTMEKWASHFKNLLNKQNNPDGITINIQTTPDNNIDDDELTIDEVQNALKRLRNN